jgi:hypothetical protein
MRRRVVTTPPQKMNGGLDVISYVGNEQTCFKQASQDDTWTPKEKQMLGEIAQAMKENYSPDLFFEGFGSGCIYWMKGQSRYKFLSHKSPVGYNIGRVGK